jgi:NitT/TauT family transport system ATP-binding protein
VIHVHDATLAYGTHTVFSGVDIRIERGLIHAIIGPTGCGKTSLLMLMAGLLKPAAGSVVFDIEKDRNHVALIPQDYGLFPWKTVGGNVLMGLEIAAARQGLFHPVPAIAKAKTDRLLQELRIHELRNRWPLTLSGGQKQRTAIARALAVDPVLLLMDEPFSALDADTREEMQSLLMELPSTWGATPVIVTHDINEALRVADRLILFRCEDDAATFIVECFPNDRVKKAEIDHRVRAALRNTRDKGSSKERL